MSALRLGTRASALATTQSGHVADLVHDRLGCEVELVEITTEGDTSSTPLAQMGGTGIFVSALREAERTAPKHFNDQDRGLVTIALQNAFHVLLHAETEGDLPFASVDIIVKTVMGEDETTYDGDYKMIVHRAEGEGVERSGKVSCSVG